MKKTIKEIINLKIYDNKLFFNLCFKKNTSNLIIKCLEELNFKNLKKSFYNIIKI